MNSGRVGGPYDSIRRELLDSYGIQDGVEEILAACGANDHSVDMQLATLATAYDAVCAELGRALALEYGIYLERRRLSEREDRIALQFG